MLSGQRNPEPTRSHWERWGVGAFVDEEGGFTTVAVALSLLVALALVLSLAQVEWVDSRSSDIQAVADATAVAGCQVVRMYTEIAQVLDACVVTLGIAGTFLMGAGLILCFIPFAEGFGVAFTDAGMEVFTTRQEFATSAAEGLRTAERALPALIYADSFTTAWANRSDVEYVGIALPFPDESKTDFNLADGEDGSELKKANEETAEATKASEEAKAKMDQASHDGWYADCGNESSCLRERASALAGLSTPYAEEGDWTFKLAIDRARDYYARRRDTEQPANDGVEERTNSALRQAYYRYALSMLETAVYEVDPDTGEPKEVSLPRLAHDTETTKETYLYDAEYWPCTLEGEQRVLHAYRDCPGATGPDDGTATFKDLDEGRVARCEVCRATIGQMGRVASISVHAASGFEYHWVQVVEASERWTEAKKELDDANEKREDSANGGIDLFEKAWDALKTPRVKLCPPGAWGCISIVTHGDKPIPDLENGFTGGVDLPSGVAIAGATLAPDKDAVGNDLISHLLDSVEPGNGGILESVFGFLLGLWGGLLELYNSMATGMGDLANTMFDGLDEFGFNWIGWPIRTALTGVIETLGLEPGDMTQKKPVLCNTDDILQKDGNTTTAKILDYIYEIDPEGSLWDAVKAVGSKALDDLSQKEITFAKLPIPFGEPIEFKVKISDILGLVGLKS